MSNRKPPDRRNYGAEQDSRRQHGAEHSGQGARGGRWGNQVLGSRSSLTTQNYPSTSRATGALPKKGSVIVREKNTVYEVSGRKPLSRRNYGSKQDTRRLDGAELQKLQSKSPNEVLGYLLLENKRFKELLNDEGDMFKDQVAIIWSVIATACSSDTKEVLADFLKILIEAESFTVRGLQQLMLEIQKGECSSKDVETIKNVMKFLETLNLLHPSITLSTITIVQLVLKDTIEAKLNVVGEDLLDQLENMEATRASLRDRYNIQFDKSLCEKGSDNLPDSFRNIPVFPDENDITNNTRPFLRPCVVNGRYENVEHYLDVQFRLLREDFVRPLREGILIYQENVRKEKQERLHDIKVYFEVTVIKSELSSDGLLHQIQIPLTENLKHIQWENSKRFIYGSLLCFTSNNFESFILATVVVRDIESLKNGKLLVRFEKKDLIEVDKDYSVKYLMVETHAFFEAYRHVLTVLQEMSAETFPLKEYIVDLDKRVKPPKYARGDHILYCLENNPNSPYHTLVQNPINQNIIRIGAMASKLFTSARSIPLLSAKSELLDSLCRSKSGVFIHRELDWSKHSMELDETQLEAVKGALTRSLAIIQGPPGTGKTYVGLKVIQILLHNRHVWSFECNSSPILVVCYTNHALDQFLEGVLKITKRIVRIGSRSKCETLSPYNIKILRKNVIADTLHPIENYEGKIKALVEKVRGIEQNRKKMYRELLPLEVITPEMTVNHLYSLERDGPSSRQVRDNSRSCLLSVWLEMTSVETSSEANNGESHHMEHHGQAKCVDSPRNTGYDNQETDALGLSYTKNSIRVRKLQSKTDCTIPNIEELADVADLDFINEQRIVDEEYQDVAKLLRCQQIAEENLEQLEDQDNPFKIQGGKKQERILFSKRMNCSPMSTAEINRCKNVWKLKVEDRWRLYRTWWDKCYARSEQNWCELKKEYENILMITEQLKRERDLAVVRNSDVVGLTTTGAAKYKHLVRGIQSKIVIVEEAAEVLEAHIVTALNENTEHLILIGDHQQLRPNPTVYELAKKYHLEMSLFERLIQNGLPYCRLGVQHRMKPCISKLLVPNIYTDLIDHSSVFEYEDIVGLEKSMFFVTHTSKEYQSGDSTSRMNVHEIDFLVELCRYILLQGYKPSQITILTTYLAQLFILKKHMVGALSEVRVSVVDNFQGEESDIILLSFVRSNEDGNIGFLKADNRVCVALSRAKKGMYCIGNFELFSSQSKLWKNICDELKEQGSYGSSMNIKCQNHGQLVPVRSAADLRKISDGGCLQECMFRLPCGHSCTKKCHPDDPSHTGFQCIKFCEKILCEVGHKCKKLCFQDCGKCSVLVEKKIPNCKHSAKMMCSKDLESYVCQMPCPKLLECGHPCPVLCGHSCGKCSVLVEKTIPSCKHFAKMECSKDPESYLCRMPCPKMLECGHPCPVLCGHYCGKCTVEVKCEAPCGHQVSAQCRYLNDSEKLLAFCQNPCKKLLTCGHQCSNNCGQNCLCKKILQYRLRCGHNQDVSCYRIALDKNVRWKTSYRSYNGRCIRSSPHVCENSGLRREFPKSLQSNHEILQEFPRNLEAECKVPCKRMLSCGHVCAGTCGTCYGGRIHAPCTEICRKTLICGHECQSPCSDICPPCKRPCENYCFHGKCRLSCGEPCIPCKKRCGWCCKHQRCNRLCFEPCDGLPCGQPCRKKLKCGHECIGMCGEPCPKKCRVCDQEQGNLNYFGNEGNTFDRFIQLDNCSHIFEIQGFADWIKTQDNIRRVTGYACPVCKKPIRKNLRFNVNLKMTLQKIEVVKKKSTELLKNKDATSRKKLLVEIQNLGCKYSQNIKSRRTFTADHLEPNIEDLSFDAVAIFEEINFHLAQENIPVLENTLIFYENLKSIVLKNYEISWKLEDEIPYFSEDEIPYCSEDEILFSSEDEIPYSSEDEIQHFCEDKIPFSKMFCTEDKRICKADIIDFIGGTLQAINKSVLRDLKSGTNQLLFDIVWEFRRLDILIYFPSIFRGFYCKPYVDSKLRTKVFGCFDLILSHAPFRETEQVIVMQQIQEVKNQLNSFAEKMCITPLKVSLLKQRLWYWCPKGHIYCKSDLELHTEEDQCKECAAVLSTSRSQFVKTTTRLPKVWRQETP